MFNPKPNLTKDQIKEEIDKRALKEIGEKIRKQKEKEEEKRKQEETDFA